MSRILNTRDLNRAKVVGDSTKKVSRSVHISSLLFSFFSRTLSTDSYFKRPFSRYELLVSRSWLDSSSLCSLVPLFLSFFFFESRNKLHGRRCLAPFVRFAPLRSFDRRLDCLQLRINRAWHSCLQMMRVGSPSFFVLETIPSQWIYIARRNVSRRNYHCVWVARRQPMTRRRSK